MGWWQTALIAFGASFVGIDLVLVLRPRAGQPTRATFRQTRRSRRREPARGAPLVHVHVGGASKILPFTFRIIMLTVLVYGLSAVPAVHVDLTEPEATQR